MPYLLQGNWALWIPESTASITLPSHICYTTYTNMTNTTTTWPIYQNVIQTSTTWIGQIFNMQNMPLEPPIQRLQRAEARVLSQYDQAEKKARELLLRHLDREQRNDYEKDRAFIVIAASRRRYRIKTHNYTANIERLDDREVFCIHGESSLPMSDHFLAQKMMIECDEEAFLMIANRHGRR